MLADAAIERGIWIKLDFVQIKDVLKFALDMGMEPLQARARAILFCARFCVGAVAYCNIVCICLSVANFDTL